MFAIRADQENFAHEQRNAAASKPLNQGGRGLAKKTPGNKAPKTPFKVPLNDENAAGRTGKDALKSQGKGFITSKSNAFVTPGPTNRIALGNKTTNAKARNFVTPGQKKRDVSPTKTQQQQKTGSPRLRRAKVKVHAEEAETEESAQDGLDIERMPPRSTPLPEYPSDDEFGPNKQFPQLRTENFMRGWARLPYEALDNSGIAISDRARARQSAKIALADEAKLEQSIQDTFNEIDDDLRKDLGLPLKSTPKPKADAPDTMRLKNAASALATAQNRRVGSANASKAHPAALNVRKSRQPAPPGPSARFANAAAASKNTLGYAQGRAISQKVRKPIASVFRDVKTQPVASEAANSQSARAHSVDYEQHLAEHSLAKLRLQELLGNDDEAREHIFASLSSLENEEDVFQLPVPDEYGE